MLFAFESFPSAVTSSKSKRTEKKANFFQKNEENIKEGMRKKEKNLSVHRMTQDLKSNFSVCLSVYVALESNDLSLLLL